MSLNPRIFPAVLVLFLTAASCFPQSAESKQQQFSAYMQKAEGYLREKRPDLAVPELEAAVKLNPDAVDAQGNLGVLLFFQGKYADAIPHLRAAVEKQPGLSKIQGLLGIAEKRAQDSANASKDLAASFPLIQEQHFKVQVGLELVELDTENNDLASAAAVIAQLQKSAPENPEVLYAAYRTYSELTIQSMLSLALVAPDSAQMDQLLAHEEQKRGDTNGAIAEYRKAIAANPNLPGAHFDLAELLKTSQDPKVKQEAEQEYRADLAQNPADAKSEQRLGEIDSASGQLAKAYSEFEKAVAMNPDDADAKLELAKMLIQMGQWEKAVPLLEQTVQLDPTIAVAHLRLSQLYRRKGMLKQSEEQVELYKKYTDLKQKLKASYKELQAQPNDIRSDTTDEQ